MKWFKKLIDWLMQPAQALVRPVRRLFDVADDEVADAILSMPAHYADEGFGTTVTFSSGFCAQITSVDGPQFKRKDIDTSHMLTTNGWMTFQPSDLKNPGQLKVSLLFDPDRTPPIGSAAETVTVTFPIPAGKTTPATWACSGFLIDFNFTDPHDDKMTAEATIKWSGQPTYTVSS